MQIRLLCAATSLVDSSALCQLAIQITIRLSGENDEKFAFTEQARGDAILTTAQRLWMRVKELDLHLAEDGQLAGGGP